MDNHALLKQMICRFRTENMDRTAFSLYDGVQVTEITYGQFAEDILKTAGYFAEHQICGKHIAIAAPNSYRWVVVFFAVMASGNIAVPLNQSLPADILQWQCESANIDQIYCEGSEILDKIDRIPVFFFDVLDEGAALPEQDLYSHRENETVLMMFTSGTTGNSKIVMLSSQNIAASITNVFSERKQKTAATEVIEKDILSLPLYHIGSVRMLLSQLEQGAVVAIGRGARYLFMDLPKLNPTRVPMVPAIAESLAKIMRRTVPEKMKNHVGRNFKSILAVGASMKAGIAKELLEKGIEINILYGMTESSGDGAWCVLDDAHIGTIGKPDGKIAFRIVDGEIQLRSDGVMQGYYKDPEETARVIVDGWLHTGDMGYCDEDGYYYITGRKKNVIILSNGENVNPEEIEVAFSNCEAIDECMVYSDGKGICADIFVNDRDIAAAYIRNYNDDMPMYRQVYKVNYADQPLPKTGSGKIKRKENV